ncbi:MAG: hypothetical protein KGJ23_01960 [Euryarchaeota archaeon]|nr:hypothetical protein [Euryarchaeota archaeon]MDE1835360.1 hypothetical protein [Euryarchaeota archaeon]MDE1880463.1 hypothetical protein [Euryarchaeota archaeon]MDE2043656.1 hypothetical protein [Thermoplasmata archaeon]
MRTNESGTLPRKATSGNVGWSALGAIALVGVTLSVGWFAFAAFYGVGVGNPASQGVPSGGNAPSGPVHMYLAVVTTPGGMDQYLPANFSLPVNTEIDFTIQNYDNGINNLSASISTVSGTSDGTEHVSGGALGAPTGVVSSLPVGDTSHTFSILGGPQHLNVVMPPAMGPNQPTVVTFSVTFTSAGTYTWVCLAPCDPNSMQAPGFMSGTITVG